jgi:Rieske 2Fe-2S family protein
VARLGLDPDAPRLPFRGGNRTQSLDGRPVAPLMGTHRDYDGTMLSTWITDTLELEANPDHVVAFRFTPLAPQRTDVEVSWLVRGDAVAGRDYDRDRLTKFWEITGEQDWRICEVVQEGVNSRYYRRGPLSRAEHGPGSFLQRYLAQLSGVE